jgi:hypothetical protein
MAYNNPIPNMLNIASNRLVTSSDLGMVNPYASNDNILSDAVALGDIYGVSQAAMFWSVFCVPQFLKGNTIITIPMDIVCKMSAQTLTRLQTKYT